MIPTQGTWADLAVGVYLKDKNGKTWKVTAERDFHFQITDREGVRKTLTPRAPKTPVTIMGATETEAMAALESTLDAHTMAHKRAGAKVWEAGVFRTAGPGSMIDARSHLYLMHGVYNTDIKDMKGLIDCHDYFTEQPTHGAGYVPHVHR